MRALVLSFLSVVTGRTYHRSFLTLLLKVVDHFGLELVEFPVAAIAKAGYAWLMTPFSVTEYLIVSVDLVAVISIASELKFEELGQRIL